MEPTKVHTNEIEGLIQQLSNTVVQQFSAPPVLSSQPLTVASPSTPLPDSEETQSLSASSESGPSPIVEMASESCGGLKGKGKLGKGSGDLEVHYPSKSRCVSTRRAKGTV